MYGAFHSACRVVRLCDATLFRTAKKFPTSDGRRSLFSGIIGDYGSSSALLNRILIGRETSCLNFESRRWKGHSHWQNIQRTKSANDTQRAVMINKALMKVRKAIRNNNGEMNPRYNRELANMLEECAAMSVPKDTIKRALDRFANEPGGQVHLFDLVGRNGVRIMVEVETTSKPKTKSAIQKICAKLGDFGIAAQRGDFQEFGYVTVLKESKPVQQPEGDDAPPPVVAPPLTLNDAETLAIELECEEVEELEADGDEPAMFKFACSPDRVQHVKVGLQGRGYTVQVAEVDYKPYTAPLLISAEQQDAVQKLYEKLEEVDGLERIFDNIDWSATAQ